MWGAGGRPGSAGQKARASGGWARPGARLLPVLLALCLAAPACQSFTAARRGDALVEEGRYEDAISVYKAAMAERSSKRLAARLTHAEGLQSQALTTGAQADLVAGQPRAAFEALVVALSLDPDNQQALDLLDRAKDACLREAAAWERRVQPTQAMDLYALVLTQYKRHDQARAGFERCRQQLADGRYRAGQRQEESHPAAALASFLAADALTPGYLDAAARAEDLKARLVAQARIPLGVSVAAPKGVKLPVDAWRAEIQASVESRGWPVSVEAKIPTRDGALALKVKVSALTAQEKRQTRPVTETVELVDDPRPNPQWEALDAQRAAAEAEAERARVDAEAKEAAWQAARDRLNASPGSPRAIEAEDAARAAFNDARSTHAKALSEATATRAARDAQRPTLGEARSVTARYDVTELTLTERLNVSGRCEIVGDAPVEVPVEIHVERTRQDTGADAVPALGRAADPLELPTAADARDALVAQVGQALVDAALSCREQQVEDAWAQAHRLADQGWKEPAADAFLEAWLAEPTRGKAEALGYLVTDLGAPETAVDQLFEGVGESRRGENLSPPKGGGELRLWFQ